MPYRIYVPSQYDPKKRFPLIVILHGRGQNQDAPFSASDGLLSQLAETHGFIVVSPLGFRTDAGFGQDYPLVVDGKILPSNVDRETAHLSEMDVMGVLQRVMSGCSIDSSNVFLMGHSMGGLGAWYLGAKYNELWSGIAVMAAAVMPPDYPLEHLRGTPVMITQGTSDRLSNVAEARAILRRMNNSGLFPEYMEIQGASHDDTYRASLPAVFHFFVQHLRAK